MLTNNSTYFRVLLILLKSIIMIPNKFLATKVNKPNLLKRIFFKNLRIAIIYFVQIHPIPAGKL